MIPRISRGPRCRLGTFLPSEQRDWWGYRASLGLLRSDDQECCAKARIRPSPRDHRRREGQANECQAANACGRAAAPGVLRSVESLLEREIGGDTLSPDPVIEQVRENTRRALEEQAAARRSRVSQRRSRTKPARREEMPPSIAQDTRDPDQ